MGCDIYQVMQPQSGNATELMKTGFSKPVTMMFNPDNDEYSCLCTFPINYKEKPEWVPIRELALLGAAVVLAHQGEIAPDNDHEWGVRTLETLVPEWIKKGIDIQVKEVKDA